MRYSHCCCVVLLAASCAGGAAAQDKPVALVGATVHPVAGPAIEDGVVVMHDGLLRAVGGRADLPDGAEAIDVAGKHVYPSLIAAYTHLGLTEVDAVRATRDARETGTLNPNARAHKAFNPDSELLPVTRSNGVLLAVTAPLGGRIAGWSSLMRLDGWTWEDMLVEPDVGLHLRWPRAKTADVDPHDHDEEEPSEDDEIDKLNELFDQAEAYAAEREAGGATTPDDDLRLAALLPVLRGEKPLIVSADRQAEIEAAVAFCVRRGLKMTLLGGYDAPRCARLLNEHGVRVIVEGVYRNPLRRHEPYDHAYTLPARLREAGVAFCITGSDRDQTWNTRNLPYHSATAIGFGLPRDEALKAVTLYAAEALGVADRVGSLEPGKHATLIVTNGDPLETPTRVERAFVRGREVDLNDRHKRLYRRFEKRLEE